MSSKKDKSRPSQAMRLVGLAVLDLLERFGEPGAGLI